MSLKTRDRVAIGEEGRLGKLEILVGAEGILCRGQTGDPTSLGHTLCCRGNALLRQRKFSFALSVSSGFVESLSWRFMFSMCT